MISWKHSFNRLNEEYNIAKKKQQALDNLYEKGKISQSTRDSYNNEISQALSEIEKQQQNLLQKLDVKVTELQSQIKTLEMLLANYEIQHVIGEIDETTYQNEINLLTTALDTAKHELDTIKEAATQLCMPVTPVAPEPTSPVIEAAPVAQPEIAPTVEAESIQITPPEPEINPTICVPETVVVADNTDPAMESAESANPEITPAENPTEASMEPPPDNLAENMTAIEAPLEVQPTIDTPIEISVEASEETIAQNVESAENVEAAVDLQVEAPVELSSETIESAPVETESEAIVEDSVEIAAEGMPEEVAVEAAVDLQVEAPVELSSETIESAPVETESEAIVEDSVEIAAEGMPEETVTEMTEDVNADLPLEPVLEDNEVPVEDAESLEPLEAETPTIEIIPQEIIQTIDEGGAAAHPTEAPKEAHTEIINETATDQDGEDSQVVVEASDEANSEN